MLKGLRHSDYERRKIASLQMEALGKFVLLSYRLLETPSHSQFHFMQSEISHKKLLRTTRGSSRSLVSYGIMRHREVKRVRIICTLEAVE